MRGIYKFYEDGVLIGTAENLITTEGKRHIIKFFSEYVGSFAKGIAVGVGVTPAAVSDRSLDFESARVAVDLVSPDYINTSVVYKGKLDEAMAGKIYEVGMWSDFDLGTPYGSKLLLGFDSVEDLWTVGTWNSAVARVGSDSLKLSPATSGMLVSSLDGVFIDLSGYSDLDQLQLAYNVDTAFVSTVKIIFHTDATNYYTYTITAPTAGYKITSFTKADTVKTGTPDWSNITSVDISVTSTAGGSGSVDFDGLRVEDADLDSELFVLVSRAVLVTPIVKTAGLALEFEYLLDLTL